MLSEKDKKELEKELNKKQEKSDETVQIKVKTKNKKFSNLSIKYKKDKKKYLVALSSFLAILSLTIGSSYAYLTYVSKTNNSVIISAGTLALTFQNEQNVINIQNAVPMKDQTGLAQEQEYSFNIKNNGSIPATYKITLDNTCETSNEIDLCIPDEYIKVGLKVGTNDYEVVERNEKNEYIIETGSLLKGGYNSYKMKIWLSYDTPNTYNSAGGRTIVYKGKLGLTYEQGTKVLVTLNANGGTIPSGQDWTGSGSTATKTINIGSTYGSLPTPTKSGYTFEGWTILPSGYQQVEYIASSGTQYIDTEYAFASPNLTIKQKYMKTTNLSKNTFGVDFNNSPRYMHGNIWNQNCYLGNSNVGTGKFAESLGEEIELEFDFNNANSPMAVWKKNGIVVHTYATANGWEGTTVTDYLFATHGPSGANYSMSGRIYYHEMYSNKAIVRSYIPCINTTTTKAGLYDLVEGTFYDNDGSGDFTPGSPSYVTSSNQLSGLSTETLTAVWNAN